MTALRWAPLPVLAGWTALVPPTWVRVATAAAVVVPLAGFALPHWL